jgi:Cu(I)/Ag(I) efflux system protein CusF
MKLVNLLAAFALSVAPAALAGAHDKAAKSAPAASMAEAEVRKVDMDAKKITLKHGQIANLDMPPMTMVFTVKDPALLQKVKQGDKVRFSADKINGVYTVTQIETAK